MTCTRPDASFALSMVSRYQGNLGENHWMAVKNILKYLQRTKDMFLVYGGKDELQVTDYTDPMFLLNGGAITWKSSKQDMVSDSMCESKYIVTSEAVEKAAWLKNFIALTKEPKNHGKSKHIERKYHFVRYKTVVSRAPSKENPMDPFMKTLTRPKYEYHTKTIYTKIHESFALGFCHALYANANRNWRSVNLFAFDINSYNQKIGIE
ncbi:hypothetical protein OSB04_019282 [Centaurea solstitialis]|uniref:Gag/pol protein n=1 Tax=Centaurea solstitialis TaxID=347529 RepID=A0AA38WE38_9ASTR|nr:hypothetical protein OSB04_019282 [Centaurea solstitialis]